MFVVAGEDLLGQRGAPAAMVACGLLSAARTAAIEGARPGFAVNVVAPEDGAKPVVLPIAASLVDAIGARHPENWRTNCHNRSGHWLVFLE